MKLLLWKASHNNLNIYSSYTLLLRPHGNLTDMMASGFQPPPPTMFFGQFISGVRTATDILAVLNLCPPVLAQL